MHLVKKGLSISYPHYTMPYYAKQLGTIPSKLLLLKHK